MPTRTLVGMAGDDRIVTGEAVALELRLAGAGSRGIAALVDLVLATLLEFGLLFVLVVVGGAINPDTLVALLIVVTVGTALGYPVLMETLWRGRTIGKAVMGLRVVRDDGGPIRFRHALVRGLSGIFIDKPGITYALGALIPMLATSRKKRIGDMMAGTVVLQERVPSRIEVPVEMPPPLAGWAAALDLTRIDDSAGLRLRQYLGRAGQLTPTARAALEHELVTDLVGRVGPPPPGTPAWAVIQAVLAERRRRAYLATTHAVAPPWPPAPSTPAVPAGPAGPDPTVSPAVTQGPDSAALPAPPSTTGFVLPG